MREIYQYCWTNKWRDNQNNTLQLTFMFTHLLDACSETIFTEPMKFVMKYS